MASILDQPGPPGPNTLTLPRMLNHDGISREHLPPFDDNETQQLHRVVRQLLYESREVLEPYDQTFEDAFDLTQWERKRPVLFRGRRKTGGPDIIVYRASGDFELRAGKKEHWAARRSYHEDSSTPGSASWEEFVRYMKDEHVKTEQEMTDTVQFAQTLYTWTNLDGLEAWPDMDGMGQSTWSDFSLSLIEMMHRLPPLMDARVFPCLQLTCTKRQTEGDVRESFYVISVPIKADEWMGVPTNKRKISENIKQVIGSYASVEVFRRITHMKKDIGCPPRMRHRVAQAARQMFCQPGTPDLQAQGPDQQIAQQSAEQSAEQPASDPGDPEQHPAGEPVIEWTMATSSHARGNLPLRLQRKSVLDIIPQDVVFFTKWLAKKRNQPVEENNEEARETNEAGDVNEGSSANVPDATTSGARVPEAQVPADQAPDGQAPPALVAGGQAPAQAPAAQTSASDVAGTRAPETGNQAPEAGTQAPVDGAQASEIEPAAPLLQVPDVEAAKIANADVVLRNVPRKSGDQPPN